VPRSIVLTPLLLYSFTPTTCESWIFNITTSPNSRKCRWAEGWAWWCQWWCLWCFW